MVKYFTETFVNRKENFSKIKLCKISVFVLFFIPLFYRFQCASFTGMSIFATNRQIVTATWERHKQTLSSKDILFTPFTNSVLPLYLEKAPIYSCFVRVLEPRRMVLLA